MNSGMDNVEVIYTVVHQERLRFYARLVQALQTAGYDTPGATEVARLYNAHCASKVSHHAVRKWLQGDSIPTQPHIACLSEWLQCDTGWLRFGSPGDGAHAKAEDKLDAVLLRDLSKLDEESKRLVRILVAAMLAQPR